MSDIFKPLYQDITNSRNFGICDDKPHQRAYIDEIDGQRWTAVVRNHYGRQIVFTAIDNCTEFNKANGSKEIRCEGILTFDDTIVFVEIKERKGDAKTWAKKADDQLRNSIRIIQARVNMNAYVVKKAYISNRHQKNLNESHAVRAKRFQQETGYILRVENRINID